MGRKPLSDPPPADDGGRGDRRPECKICKTRAPGSRVYSARWDGTVHLDCYNKTELPPLSGAEG